MATREIDYREAKLMKLIKLILFAFVIISLIPMYILHVALSLFIILFSIAGIDQPSDAQVLRIGAEMFSLLITKPISFSKTLYNNFFS